MDLVKRGWFSEVNDLWPDISLSLEVKSILYEGKSDYHNILVLDTEKYGKTLILDGLIQVCEFDEFVYHEMISFIPIYCHANPQKVLIVGGGDGGVAKQICKVPEVIEVVQVERDQKVIDICKKYLPFVAEGLSHPKLKLYVEDELQFIEKHKSEFDIIITDSLDPINTSNKIFDASYYHLLKKAIRPDGILCTQLGSPWVDLDLINQTFRMCETLFSSVSLALVSLPTYTTSQISFILTSHLTEIFFKWPYKTLYREDKNKLKMRYYTSDGHFGAFLLPMFVEDTLGCGEEDRIILRLYDRD